MYSDFTSPEDILEAALAIAGRPDALLAALDTLPAPIYVTDCDGVITYFNSACIDFTGRVPEIGQDRWCIAWKLYSDDGQPVPLDQSPMADTIRQGQPVRGVLAVAERPDGTRVRFLPYPTPLLDAEGRLRGAINLLVDVTDGRQAVLLRIQAAKCRRLSRNVDDDATAETLLRLSDEYEQKADSLDRRG